jgi:hypothetical protein
MNRDRVRQNAERAARPEDIQVSKKAKNAIELVKQYPINKRLKAYPQNQKWQAC